MEKSSYIDTIIVGGKQFERIKFDTESDFEDYIVSNINNFFKNHHVFPFKYTLETNDRFQPNVRADLIIISKNLNSWKIIEVEYVAKKHKWLEKHVVPQMDKITHFNYTNDAENIIKWLFANYSSQIKKLDIKKLTDLIQFNKPGFLVVLNKYPLDVLNWKTALYNCELAVLKVYRNYLHEFIYTTDYIKLANHSHSTLLHKKNTTTKICAVEKPSLIYDINLEQIRVSLGPISKNNQNKFITFKIHKTQKNLLIADGELKKGLYRLTINNEQIELNNK